MERASAAVRDVERAMLARLDPAARTALLTSLHTCADTLDHPGGAGEQR